MHVSVHKANGPLIPRWLVISQCANVAALTSAICKRSGVKQHGRLYAASWCPDQSINMKITNINIYPLVVYCLRGI